MGAYPACPVHNTRNELDEAIICVRKALEVQPEALQCKKILQSSMISVLEKHKPTIVVEDASHLWSHQIATFEIIFPYLEKCGTYICEDIHTSFGSFREGSYNDQSLDGATYFSNLALVVANDGNPGNHPSLQNITKMQKDIAKTIDYMCFRSHCVLIKRK